MKANLLLCGESVDSIYNNPRSALLIWKKPTRHWFYVCTVGVIPDSGKVSRY